VTPTLDLDAPIVPGLSAAGIRVGTLLEQVLATAAPDEVVDLDGCIRYTFGPVSIWAKGGRVDQIGVFAGYRGRLEGSVAIGSTIADVEGVFAAAVIEDDEDNLVVAGVPGWCFETETWTARGGPELNAQARVNAIFVFAAS
jgi:hypothetical protein